MRKGYKAKNRWSAGFLLLLLVAVWLTAMPRQVWAADRLPDVKQMEEGIVSWKSSSEGEKELLTGELRDQAGSAGSDWFAFDVARMGSATEEQRAAYLARLQDAVEAVYANKEDSMMRLRISEISVRIRMEIPSISFMIPYGTATAAGETRGIRESTVISGHC